MTTRAIEELVGGDPVAWSDPAEAELKREQAWKENDGYYPLP